MTAKAGALCTASPGRARQAQQVPEDETIRYVFHEYGTVSRAGYVIWNVAIGHPSDKTASFF
jgi:hypothetical protein